MSKSNVVARDIDRETEDLLPQPDTIADDTCMEDQAQTASDTSARIPVVEYLTGVRRMMSDPSLTSQAVAALGYWWAPDDIKHVLEGLIDPDTRDEVFDLLIADAEEDSKKEERK